MLNDMSNVDYRSLAINALKVLSSSPYIVLSYYKAVIKGVAQCLADIRIQCAYGILLLRETNNSILAQLVREKVEKIIMIVKQ